MCNQGKQDKNNAFSCFLPWNKNSQISLCSCGEEKAIELGFCKDAGVRERAVSAAAEKVQNERYFSFYYMYIRMDRYIDLE